MRAIIGAILAAAGGAAAAYGITTVSRVGTCFENCGDVFQAVPFMGGGIVVVVISAFFWRYAMVLAPVVGLATAAVLLSLDGVDLVGDNLGLTAFIALCVLAGPAILAAVGIWSARRRALAHQIASNGLRAVAEIQGVQGTGVEINNQPQVAITYLIHPLDGSGTFPYRQRRTIGFGDIRPQVGFRWPAWYLPGKQDKVAIGSPNASPTDPETRRLLAEFGIPATYAYGYDPDALGTGLPPQRSASFGAPQGFGGGVG